MKACNQCGKCCMKYSDGGLSASAEEIEAWRVLRPDIYQYVRGGKIWMDPDTGEQLTLCPWLRKLPDQEKYSCDIYDYRPEDCRYYPTTIEEMIKHGCEMLEPHDLVNTKLAQNTLDELMADSRPALE